MNLNYVIKTFFMGELKKKKDLDNIGFMVCLGVWL
jgi:hypothetical protein